ncbi:MAG: hypothetical protein KDD47_16950, partial [Acidobacteria bacterium]|nr:hypothetical protein [Acidobacteriota bacterium]
MKLEDAYRFHSQRHAVLPVILLLLSSCTAHAPTSSEPEEANVAPGINARYEDENLDVESWVGRFSSESREVFVAR